MTAVTKHEPRGQAVAQVSDTNSFLGFIAEAARDPSVDVSKMERLFDMRERMLAREAHLEFNAALKRAKADMPAVLKNKYNEHKLASFFRMWSL